MVRNSTIDIMKGLAILAVIAGHGHMLLPDCLERKLIYSFHMPLFFIVAGYLYKPTIHYKTKIIADSRRLLIPYLFIVLGFTTFLLVKESDKAFALKYSFIACIFGSSGNHASLLWAAAPHIGIGWFLPALFWCRQFFNYIDTQANHATLFIIFLAFIATITDYYLVNLPFALLPGVSAMVFYQIGSWVRNIKTKSLPLFLGGAICWGLQINYFGINMSICYYGFYPIDILGASFATTIIYYISRWLSNNALGNVFRKIGQMSIYVYCSHALEAEIKPYTWFQLNMGWLIEFIFRATLCISIAYCFIFLKTIFPKPHNT